MGLQPAPRTLFWARFAAIGDICMSACLYLDPSAVLRAVLESGTSPEVEDLIAAAPALISSRLSLVESARASSLATARTGQRSEARRRGVANEEALFRRRLREIVIQKYGSLDRLYLETDFSKGHLSQILRGKRSPSLATMVKLARALDVEVADFFAKTGSKRPRS